MTRSRAKIRTKKRTGNILQALQGNSQKMAAASVTQVRSILPELTEITTHHSKSFSTPTIDYATHLEHTADPIVKAMETLTIRFESMLNKALENLTIRLTSEINELVGRIVEAEDKVRELEVKMELYEQQVLRLHEDNFQLTLKFEEQENRLRRSNLRIRGIPEHITEISAFVSKLLQELVPNMAAECLELDSIYRASTRRKIDGLPRDIVVKLHHNKTRDVLLAAARDKTKLSPLISQGQSYQLYADIAASTIQRRREFKPFLEILVNRQVEYRWGYPFCLLFSYQNIQISCSTVTALTETFQRLDLPVPSSVKQPAGTNKTRTSDKKRARIV